MFIYLFIYFIFYFFIIYYLFIYLLLKAQYAMQKSNIDLPIW